MLRRSVLMLTMIALMLTACGRGGPIASEKAVRSAKAVKKEQPDPRAWPESPDYATGAAWPELPARQYDTREALANAVVAAVFDPQGPRWRDLAAVGCRVDSYSRFREQANTITLIANELAAGPPVTKGWWEPLPFAPQDEAVVYSLAWRPRTPLRIVQPFTTERPPAAAVEFVAALKNNGGGNWCLLGVRAKAYPEDGTASDLLTKAGLQ